MLLLSVKQVNTLKRTHVHARVYKRTVHIVQMKHVKIYINFSH